jgi:hypothetical protein
MERLMSIYAFTDKSYPTPFPEYLYVDRQDGEITVTVRGPVDMTLLGGPHDMPGDSATMTLPEDEARKLLEALKSALP